MISSREVGLIGGCLEKPLCFSDLFLARYDNRFEEQLASFCKRCGQLGLTNNDSIAKLKLSRLQPPEGELWLILHHQKILALAGAHKFDNFKTGVARVLNRAVVLPELRGAVNGGALCSNHFSSPSFGWMLKPQIEWANQIGASSIVITTNLPPIGQTKKSSPYFKADFIFHRLARQGFVSLIQSDVELMGYRQNVWELNVERVLLQISSIPQLRTTCFSPFN